MKITIVSIANRARSLPFDPLASLYLERLAPYSTVETTVYRYEGEFFEAATRQNKRTPPVLALLDSRGKARSSEEFAAWLGTQRDSDVQHLIFAIGPPSGWSDQGRDEARQRANLLSLGPMTMPHELVRIVLAEQLYRAFTILAGHPYHTGH